MKPTISTSQARQFKADFLESLKGQNNISDLFYFMADVYFYAKNVHSQFVMCNKAIQTMAGAECEEEMLGHTDRSFYPPHMADKYIEEDQIVLNGTRIINEIWLVPHKSGKNAWYLSSKIPLQNAEGEVIGLAGTLRDISKSGSELEDVTEMAEVIDHIKKNYMNKISIKTLADLMKLSISQFDRRFKKTFLVTPSDYIVKVRANVATHMLANTSMAISKIALECGFYDHSYFTKQFSKVMGVSPSVYRENYKLKQSRSVTEHE